MSNWLAVHGYTPTFFALVFVGLTELYLVRELRSTRQEIRQGRKDVATLFGVGVAVAIVRDYFTRK